MNEKSRISGQRCPVFGVRSGAPVIGLGILILLFGLIPFLIFPTTSLPVPILLFFVCLGLFLAWVGITK